MVRIQRTEGGLVNIWLPNEKKPRRIGQLSDDGKVFETIRDPRKHFYRKLHGYAFNFDFLKESTFDILIVNEVPSGRRLVARRTDVLTKGILLCKPGGCEKQVVYPLSEFSENGIVQELIP